MGLLGLSGWILSMRFEARIEREMAAIRAAPATPESVVDLPPLLASYLERTALPEGRGWRWVRVQQRGEMRQSPDQAWKPFDAVQLYSISSPSFVWKADFKGFQVVDSVVSGSGRLEARILGAIPVARASGVETTRAQILRYMAEMVWVPPAFSDNAFIAWRQVGEREVQGTLEHTGKPVDLRYFFDEQGDIVRVEGIRDRTVGEQTVATPWVGVFSNYRVVDGLRVPTHGVVQWMLDSGPFPYWRGTITALETG